MNFKESVKSDFTDNKEKNEFRYFSAKIIFVVFLTLFFVVFYFVWAWIWKNFLEKFLSPLYILFILSFNLFVFFLWQKLFPNKKIIAYIISLLFLALPTFFILPLI